MRAIDFLWEVQLVHVSGLETPPEMRSCARVLNNVTEVEIVIM
jgi:hypothetical protein